LAHPEQVRLSRAADRAKSRRKHLLKKYGLSEEMFQGLLISQRGVCAICGSGASVGRVLLVDHDHQTGKVRGLLCWRCNSALGFFRDDTGILAGAIDYLRRSRETG
jgi:Recombination endonuclease VII